MTDHLDIPPEPEDHTLLNKLDAILKKYRKEYSAVIRPADLKAPPTIPESSTPATIPNPINTLPSSPALELPILTEEVVVAPEVSFNESGISLLLCYAFDTALKEDRKSVV